MIPRTNLPAGWAWVPLDSLANVLVSTVDKKSYGEETPVKLCNYTDVYYNNKISDGLEFMQATASADQISRFSVTAGDIPITKDSESSDDIGRPSYVPESLPGVVYGYHIAIYRPFDPSVGPFISYLFEASSTRGELEIRTPGVTRVGLSRDTLRNLRVPYPGPGLAQVIADYLSRETAEIDALVTDLYVASRLLKERWRASVEAAVNSSTAPLAPLKRFGHIQTGITLGSAYPGEVTQEYPYIRVANVQVGVVDTAEMKAVSVPQRVADAATLRSGDVLLTEGGDRDKLGRGALWKGSTERTLHQNHVFAFRCNSLLIPEYLVYTLEASHARCYFDVTARQSTNLASTNSSIVLAFPLSVPAVDEQLEVVSTLAEKQALLKSEQDDLSRAIALAKERRAALITAAVTGQIDVTANHRPAAEQLEDDIKELT